MREYGQIQCAFWADPDTQSLSDQAKLLATYLLTGSHSNGIGCYRLPYGYVQADFGWTNQTVSKAFAELFEIGFCKRCEVADFVLIPKFLYWNPISNGNVAKARQREFESVPKKSLIHKDLAVAMIGFGQHFTEGFERVLKGYAEQDPTLPNPDPTPKESPDGDSSPESDDGPVNCPAEKIVEVYHEVLPELPKVKILDNGRRQKLRTRWRESPKHQDLDFWQAYFGAVRKSGFLMGEKKDWRADFDFLMRPQSFRKVIEGSYEDAG